jgi:quercetin dioxygenase-like cupin family protein
MEQSNPTGYTFLGDLNELIREIPTDSIISRTIYKDVHLKAVLFGFASGQALSEHSAAQYATIQILSGQATITLGNDTYKAESGAWIHMPPHLKHSITAQSPLVMLLLLLNSGCRSVTE